MKASVEATYVLYTTAAKCNPREFHCQAKMRSQYFVIARFHSRPFFPGPIRHPRYTAEVATAKVDYEN